MQGVVEVQNPAQVALKKLQRRLLRAVAEAAPKLTAP